MFGGFLKKSDQSKSFWKWFTKNKNSIERFIDSNHADYRVYQQMTQKIKEFNEYLFPELSKTRDGKYVLIITPDGIEAGIEPTQRLWESRSVPDNWIVNKFRQPTDEVSLSLRELEYPSTDIEIIPMMDEEKEKVNIRVFIRNMNCDPEKYKHLAFLYLDHILGEFNTITRVGYIEFAHLDPGARVRDGISILELRKLIERELY